MLYYRWTALQAETPSLYCHTVLLLVDIWCLQWHNAQGVGLSTKSLRVHFPAVPFHFYVTTLGKLFTHKLRSPSSINWYGSMAEMPCGWQRNHRSGIMLTMHHRLQWFIHLWAQPAHSLRKGDEHPTLHSYEIWDTLPFSIWTKMTNCYLAAMYMSYVTWSTHTQLLISCWGYSKKLAWNDNAKKYSLIFQNHYASTVHSHMQISANKQDKLLKPSTGIYT